MRSRFDTVAAIAASQHGRVARRQLLEAGIDRSRIARWLADGRLHRVHRGVYAVGHLARSLRGDYMAAVLACGEDAALSHWPAGYVLRIRRSGQPPPEVTVAGSAARARPGITVHSVRVLHALDVYVVDGIRMTTVARTLLDLAPSLSLPDLTRACHEAAIHHRTTPAQVLACMRRNPRRPGCGRLRTALEATLR